MNRRHISTAYLGCAVAFEEALECLINFLVSVHFKILSFPVLYFQLLGNFLQWYGILSNKTLQELSIDGLLNRYILMAFQNSEYGEDSIKKAQSVSKIKQGLKSLEICELRKKVIKT